MKWSSTPTSGADSASHANQLFNLNFGKMASTRRDATVTPSRQFRDSFAHRLYLHTKLSNPHYPPEIQAETTLINFTVTQAGLSDQLNVLVLGKERADLSEMSEVLVKQQTGFKIKMGELEDEILDRLANAEGDITEDVELIEGLEETKRISTDITKKSAVAKETQASIEITSKKYKSVADRSSMLFFLMSDLAKIHSYYVYSLAAYTKVFYRGIDLVTDKPEPELDEDGNELPVKVVELTDEELAARCIVRTRRPFPKFSELQVRRDVTPPRRRRRGSFATPSLDTGPEQIYYTHHVQLSPTRIVREGQAHRSHTRNHKDPGGQRPVTGRRRLVPIPRQGASRSRHFSASCGAAAPSRHRRASSPGEDVVASFFFEFGANRTESSEPRCSAQATWAPSTSGCRKRSGRRSKPWRASNSFQG